MNLFTRRFPEPVKPKSRLPRILLAMALVAWAAGADAHAQRIAKYGADFLAGGVGARALAMGGAHVALTGGVDAAYWNPAGLSLAEYPEVAYMHAERFAGIVSFDYAGVAYPVDAVSTVGLSFFRSGVNDIKNTLNAWDGERNQPRANPESYIRSFSAADMAFFLSYARDFGGGLAAGASGKIIRRAIGDFADAWGYSFDIGAQWRSRRFVLGANLQDASTMLQSWSVNASAFELEGENAATGQPYTFEDVFAQELPRGETYLVLPVLRLGSGARLRTGAQGMLSLGLDVDVAFDGQRAAVMNAGELSFHPRAGIEYSFRDIVALRAGINRLTTGSAYGWSVVPSAGAGLRLSSLAIDYGFGDFGGLTSELGYSHRVSVQFSLERGRFRRPPRTDP